MMADVFLNSVWLSPGSVLSQHAFQKIEAFLLGKQAA